MIVRRRVLWLLIQAVALGFHHPSVGRHLLLIAIRFLLVIKVVVLHVKRLHVLVVFYLIAATSDLHYWCRDVLL